MDKKTALTLSRERQVLRERLGQGIQGRAFIYGIHALSTAEADRNPWSIYSDLRWLQRDGNYYADQMAEEFTHVVVR